MTETSVAHVIPQPIGGWTALSRFTSIMVTFASTVALGAFATRHLFHDGRSPQWWAPLLVAVVTLVASTAGAAYVVESLERWTSVPTGAFTAGDAPATSSFRSPPDYAGETTTDSLPRVSVLCAEDDPSTVDLTPYRCGATPGRGVVDRIELWSLSRAEFLRMSTVARVHIAAVVALTVTGSGVVWGMAAAHTAWAWQAVTLKIWCVIGALVGVVGSVSILGPGIAGLYAGMESAEQTSPPRVTVQAWGALAAAAVAGLTVGSGLAVVAG